MGYAWPFVGELQTPIVTLTEQQFVGRALLANPAKDPKLKLVMSTPPRLDCHDGDRVPAGFGQGLTLQQAWQSRAHAKRYAQHRMQLMPHTCGGLKLFDGDTFAGATLFGRVHLETPYQGQGLAAELIAAYEVAFPQNLRSYALRTPQRVYTEDGLKAMRAAYALLVERGAVSQLDA